MWPIFFVVVAKEVLVFSKTVAKTWSRDHKPLQVVVNPEFGHVTMKKEEL